ncbi:PucR family transcriptional regulator ligand-binding domain-containing protein [Sporanaerobacter acetigenes]|uniref:PucR family transcriptional regulator ligand-binding domain-containing protein n=1 Tax=Sporanaerobacter acetigenes TaxID=165813 RepID=UPI00332F2D4F
MVKRTVESLFKLPSMSNSYLAAGERGILKEIKRIDILETPYPEVEKFLEPNEFIFTSFWNSKDDKNSRIKLVECMIKHKCAGIGIMAGLNLHGIIDKEIIELGNKRLFPIIFIDTNARWSDIIKEFYDLYRDNKIDRSFSDINISKVLSCVEKFYIYKNVDVLCNDISEILQLPTIIISGIDTYFSSYGFKGNINEKILAKINGIRATNNYSCNVPITIYLNSAQYILAYYGDGSVFATVVDKTSMENHKVSIFHEMALFIISNIDNIEKEQKLGYDIKSINNNKRYYLFLFRKENINKSISFLKKEYFIYKINEDLNFIICLIDEEKVQRESIYTEYSKIIDMTNPDCFIFSELFFDVNSIHVLVKSLTSQIGNLFFLKGIYSIGEIPILYMLTITPYSYKENIHDFYSRFLNYNEETLFIDTLRLFIVLKSINNVAELLNVHPNTVKYRILKVVSSEIFYTTNITTDIWNLEFLLPLEMLKIETFD